MILCHKGSLLPASGRESDEVFIFLHRRRGREKTFNFDDSGVPLAEEKVAAGT